MRACLALVVLLLLAAGALAYGQSTELLPNGTFEQGVNAPTGWAITSGGTGRWEPFGEEGARSLSVTGRGEDNVWWWSKVTLPPNAMAHTSFWVKQTAGSGGTVVSGVSAVNRDYSAGPEWEQHEYYFRTPTSTQGLVYRLGEWHMNGTVAFDDARLQPAFAVYAQPEGLDLPLGDGESISQGHYQAEHRLGGIGATNHRCLDSFSAGFNTNRWVFSAGSQVVYRHAVGQLRQSNGVVEISVNYCQRGRLTVEASADTKTWTALGVADRVNQYRWPLPKSLERSPEVWVRLRAADDCDLQVDRYRYECDLPSAQRVARAVGATQYFAVTRALRTFTATVSALGPGQAGDSQLALQLRSEGQRRAVEVLLSLTQQGKEVAQGRAQTVVTPGKPVPVTLNYRAEASGPSVLRITCREPETHQVFWEAEGVSSVPLLYDARGGEVLSAGRDLAIWWCEPERKVSRTRPLPQTRGEAVRISTAGNEYEAAQVVLTPKRMLRQCRVAASDLAGPQGARLPASEVEVRLVDYVFTAVPTDELGTADEWPDPLPLLRDPIDLPAGRNQPLWVTVHVPAGTPAGDYRGALTLTAESVTQQIPLQVHVWGFDLPKETHVRSGFGLSQWNLGRYQNLTTDAELRQVWELYLQDFARHRIAPYAAGRGIGVTWEKTASGAEPKLDFAGFDEDMHHALDELGFNGFRLDLDGLGGGTFYERRPGEIAGYKQGTPEYEAAFRKYVQAVQAHLEEKGWLKKAYVYWFDEPSEQDTPFVADGMDLIHRSGPKLTRLLTTAPRPSLFGKVDLWCLPTNTLNPEVARQRKAAGEELWWYLCTAPKAPYFTLFLDHYGTETRLWLWETWKYGLDGILVWESTYWTSDAAYPNGLQNPWQDPMSWVSGYGTPSGSKQPWGNGDGRFLYPPNRDPGKDTHPYLEGPVPSIRWELLRDGMEDYEYFWTLRAEIARLRAAGADPASYEEAEGLLQVPAEVCTSSTQFARTPEPIHAHRAKLAEAIEELKRR